MILMMRNLEIKKKFVCGSFRLTSHMITYFISKVTEITFAFYQMFIMVCWCKRYTNGMKRLYLQSAPERKRIC